MPQSETWKYGGDMRLVCRLAVFLSSVSAVLALSGCVQDGSSNDARMDAAVIIPQCADGIDNDDDGRIDLDDPDVSMKRIETKAMNSHSLSAVTVMTTTMMVVSMEMILAVKMIATTTKAMTRLNAATPSIMMMMVLSTIPPTRVA